MNAMCPCQSQLALNAEMLRSHRVLGELVDPRVPWRTCIELDGNPLHVTVGARSIHHALNPRHDALVLDCKRGGRVDNVADLQATRKQALLALVVRRTRKWFLRTSASCKSHKL